MAWFFVIDLKTQLGLTADKVPDFPGIAPYIYYAYQWINMYVLYTYSF